MYEAKVISVNPNRRMIEEIINDNLAQGWEHYDTAFEATQVHLDGWMWLFFRRLKNDQ